MTKDASPPDMMKDYLFLETDDSCALCGQRGVNNLTEHHIDENRTNNSYDNRIVLCYNCHGRYNKYVAQEKGSPEYKNSMRDEIRERKRRLIKKTLTQYGVNALKIAARDMSGVVATPFLLYHLVELGFMTQAAEPERMDKGQPTLSRFFITKEGTTLCNKWLRD